MTYIEWGILGLFLVLMELFTPGTYLIWFGLSALFVTSGLYFDFIPETVNYQLVAFALASLVFAGLGMFVYRAMNKKFSSNDGHVHLNDLASQYLGQTATLIQDVQDGKSKVKVGDTVWLAKCGEDLKAGDKVLIAGVEKGLIFIVTQA